MTTDEIKSKIAEELKSQADLTNVFGLDLTRCLVDPIHENYNDVNVEQEADSLWTVLEETPQV